MVRPVSNHDHVFAEAVEHRADQMIGKAQAHRLLFPTEHAEHFLGIRRQIQLRKVLRALARRLQRGDVRHLVHAVVLAQLGLGIPRQQVVILIVPHQCQRAYDIVRARLAVTPLLGNGVFKVVKTDLPVPGNRVGDLVYIIINALIHALDAAVNIDLPLQELRIIDAGKILDLFDERQRLFMRDKLGRLDAVHKQFELRRFKCACANIVPGRLGLGLYDVQAECAQRLQIAVNALALGRHAALGQLRDHLRHGHRVTLIRLLQHNLHQVQQLQFLIR